MGPARHGNANVSTVLDETPGERRGPPRNPARNAHRARHQGKSAYGGAVRTILHSGHYVNPANKVPGRRGNGLTDRGISLGAPRGSPIPRGARFPSLQASTGASRQAWLALRAASLREKLRNTRAVVLRRRRQAAWRFSEVLRFPPAAPCRGNEEPGMAQDRERDSAKALALFPAELAS